MENFVIHAKYINQEGKAAIQNQILQARNNNAKWNEIAEISHIPKTTLHRWASKDMSVESQKRRQEHPRKKRLLNDEEELELLNLCVSQRGEHEIVSLDWTRSAINKITNGRVPNASYSYISKFFKKHGWPSRRKQERNQKELRASLEQEVIDFRSQVQSYVQTNNIPQSRIFTMDETGLWNGSVATRTFVDPSTMDSSVVSPGDHRRDTGVVALSADGEVHPYFIPHTPQRTQTVNGNKVVTQRKVSGMGNDQMVAWSKEFGNKFGHTGGTVLMMDRLRAHTNQKIQSTLEEKHVKCFYFPPQGAKLGSVCDNSFFSALKSRLKKMDTSTTEKKKEAFFELCRNFSPEMVKKFYHHCGWNFEFNN